MHVLITGAGRGIGLAVTREYVTRGDVVYAGYRSLEKAPELQEVKEQHGDRVVLVPLEVTSCESIVEAVDAVRDAGGTLDVLINNAAISPGDITTEGPEGTSLIAIILLVGGAQLVVVGVLGEYLARVYAEAKRRPPYVVARRHR